MFTLCCVYSHPLIGSSRELGLGFWRPLFPESLAGWFLLDSVSRRHQRETWGPGRERRLPMWLSASVPPASGTVSSNSPSPVSARPGAVAVGAPVELPWPWCPVHTSWFPRTRLLAVWAPVESGLLLRGPHSCWGLAWAPVEWTFPSGVRTAPVVPFSQALVLVTPPLLFCFLSPRDSICFLQLFVSGLPQYLHCALRFPVPR